MKISRRHLFSIGAIALLIGLVLGVAVGRMQTPFEFGNSLSFEDPRSSRATDADRPPSISVDELQKLLQTQASIEVVDVREPDEFAALHIPGARSMPLGALWTRQGTIPRDRPVVVYCTSDMRGEIAARELIKLGLTNIRYLDGGISAWQDAGLNVVH